MKPVLVNLLLLSVVLALIASIIFILINYPLQKKKLSNSSPTSQSQGPSNQPSDNLNSQSRPLLKSCRAQFDQVNQILNQSTSSANKAQIAQLLTSALSDCKKVTEISSQSAAAWGLLGDTYRLYDSHVASSSNLAIDSYKQAIALDSGVYQYHYGLGLVYYSLKQYPSATDEFTLVTKMNAPFAESYYYLGLISEAQGSKAQAKEYYKKAYEYTDPISPLGFTLVTKIRAL
jgi:tetratricopeptide (TPR) repeat protein